MYVNCQRVLTSTFSSLAAIRFAQDVMKTGQNVKTAKSANWTSKEYSPLYNHYTTVKLQPTRLSKNRNRIPEINSKGFHLNNSLHLLSLPANTQSYVYS
jgi:hypothetical protein